MFFGLRASSQSDIDSLDIRREYEHQSLGLGIGIEYGSIIGFQYAYYFNSKVGLIAAGGIVPNGVSAGLGLKYRPWVYNQPKFLTPYFMAMLTPVKGVEPNVRLGLESKLFYGAMSGVGVEVRDKKWKKIFFRAAFHVYSDFGQLDDYVEELNAQGSTFSAESRNYTISFGFHYAI